MLRASDRPAHLGLAARCHEGAEALGIEPAEIGEAGRVAELAFSQCEELAQVALVGLERLVRVSALVCQVREPCADRVAQVLGQRQLAVVEHVRQGRAAHGFRPGCASRAPSAAPR